MKLQIVIKNLSTRKALPTLVLTYIKGSTMKLSKFIIVLFILSVSQCSFASDIVPFSIKRIKPIGAGYIELVGPGKIRIDNKVFPFEEIKYVRKANIDTLTSVSGSDKGCILAYSSENYTQNISVQKQSCNEILSILSIAK